MSNETSSRVLLLESDTSFARRIIEALAAATSEVTSVTTLEEAMSSLKERRFDVTMIGLSHVEGLLELTTLLRGPGADLAVLVMAADVSETGVFDALQAGVQEVLRKSDQSLARLPEALSRCVHWVRQRRRLAELEGRQTGDPSRHWNPSQRLEFVGTWQWDMMTGAVRWSDGMFRLHGVEPHDFEGTLQGCRKYFHPDELPILEADVQRLMESGSFSNIQYRIIRPDGEIRHLWTYGEVIAFDNGKPAQCIGTTIDVTDRVRRETVVRESELRLRRVVDHVPVMMVAFNPAGALVAWNRECERVTGYLAEEMMVHHHPRELLFTDTPADVAHRHSRRGEFRSRAKDGRMLTIAWSSMAEECPVPGWSSWYVGIDVTERVAAEVALRESQRRHADLINNLDGIVWEADPETLEYVFVSRQAERILGYPLSAWKNKSFWRDHLHPADVQRTLSFSRERVRRGEDYDYEYRMIAADGREVWLHDQVAVAFESGRPVRVRGLMIDVTERRRAEAARMEVEERFQQIVKYVRDVFWICNDDPYEILFVSPSYEQVWGRPRELLYSDPGAFLTTIHPEDRERIRSRIEQRQRTGIFDEEYRIVRPDGDVRWIRDRAFPIYNASGQIYRTTGIAEDVTRQKLAEQKLATQNDELLHVSRLSTMGQLAAALSHEVAQPLVAVSNFAAAASILLEEPSPSLARLREYVHNVERQSKRAGAILKGLRDFTRRTPPTRQPCDLNRVLRDSVDLIIGHLKRCQAVLDWELTEPLPTLLANRVQIQQVVVNLLTNAADALMDVAPSRRRIILRSKQIADTIVLEVEDQGLGFPADVIPRLFNSFVTNKPDGMGIGLSICRTIVSEHGGTIETLAAPSGGALLRVQLPVVESMDGTAAPQA